MARVKVSLVSKVQIECMPSVGLALTVAGVSYGSPQALDAPHRPRLLCAVTSSEVGSQTACCTSKEH